jgi:hypothetical protein
MKDFVDFTTYTALFAWTETSFTLKITRSTYLSIIIKSIKTFINTLQKEN